MEENRENRLKKLVIEYLEEYGLVEFLRMIAGEYEKLRVLYDCYISFFKGAADREEGHSGQKTGE